jgi:pyruvate dehydrogenase E1 component beta subunit
LLKSAIRDDNPIVFLEGEMLYNTKGEVPEGEHIVPIGQADIKREGGDVTIICHSKTVSVALKAAEQLAGDGVNAEVLDLRTIRPLDRESVLKSVAKTHRCVVVEEGWPFAGVGAQVVDTVQREAFDELDAPILRVTGADVPMPYNKQLEKAAKADPAKVIAAVHQVLYRE